jgi:predicted dehydrogenase
VWRIGILSGTGTARKRTIPALRDSHICRVAVVHGRSRAQLRRIAELDPAVRLVVEVEDFVDLQDLYDIVYVASPPFLHLPQLEAAIQLGKPMICEKPLAADKWQYEQILQLIRCSGIPFMVAHHVRHQRAVADISDMLRRETLGTPVSAGLQWCFTMDDQASNARWKLDARLGGSSVMFDSGIHAIDLAVHLFGVPKRVSAFGYGPTTAGNTFRSVAALLDYDRFPVVITASNRASTSANDLQITFESAVLRARGLLGEKPTRAVVVLRDAGEESLTYEETNLYRAEVEAFCESLSGGQPMSGTTAHEAAASGQILFAIEDALRRDAVVQL